MRMCLGTMIWSSKMGTKLIKIRREAERSDGGEWAERHPMNSLRWGN